MRKGLTLLLLVTAAFAAAAAAEGTAWFGTPGPAPLSDPRKPVMKYDDVFAPLPARFAHRAGRFDELLDAAALRPIRNGSSASRSRASAPATRCGGGGRRRRRSCTRWSGPSAR